MCLFAPFLIEAQDESDAHLLSSCVSLEQQIFSESSLEKKDSLLLAKAVVYKQYQDFENALKTIDRISNLAGPDLSSRVMDEKIKLNYLMGNHKQVKNLIAETIFLEDYQKSKDIILFESLNYVALQELDQARESFETLVRDKEVITHAFRKVKFKNPEKAFILSFIVPGSGQIYAGRTFKGLLSLGVQAPLFYVGFSGISRGYVFTESIPSIALFQGFYFGGAEYAKELAIEYNQATIEELSSSMISAIKKEASLN